MTALGVFLLVLAFLFVAMANGWMRPSRIIVGILWPIIRFIDWLL